MKPKDKIRRALLDHVVPRLSRLNFSFSESSLGFVRKEGVFSQRIVTHLNRLNAEDVCAEFYFSFAVRSNYYVKWYVKEFERKPTNDCIASEMYWNLSGWKYPKPDVAFEENVERDMLQLLDDTLEFGIPFLEKHSSWENAADRLVSERWFHAKACDFCLIANNKEKAYRYLQKALDDWRLQPNRSFYLGEREDVDIRFQRFFGEKRNII